MAIELPRVTARRDPGPVLWAVAGGCWLLLAGLAVLNPGLAHHHAWSRICAPAPPSPQR
jgi:hypothetical protein